MTNKHLAKAKDYIGKGDKYYRQAGQEMGAAKDEGWTAAAIGRELGRGETWVRDIVVWATDPRGREVPFAEKESRSRNVRGASKVLRESTPEQIKQVLADLPPDQIEAVQTVAKDVAWEQSDEAEAASTPLMPAGVAKRREARQRSIRRAISVLDVLVGLDKSRSGLQIAVEALTEVELSGAEAEKVNWRLQQIKQAVELIEGTIAAGGRDWDAALAELES